MVENVLVSEADGVIEVCLVKDMDTAFSIQVNIVVQDILTAPNSATGKFVHVCSYNYHAHTRAKAVILS